MNSVRGSLRPQKRWSLNIVGFLENERAFLQKNVKHGDVSANMSYPKGPFHNFWKCGDFPAKNIKHGDVSANMSYSGGLFRKFCKMRGPFHKNGAGTFITVATVASLFRNF